MSAMGLRDITGVFSRYFIVGFFIPTLFTLVVLERILSPDAVPDALEAYDEDTRILVLGAISLFVGLVLVGLGGFLLDAAFRVGPLGRALRRRQMRMLERLLARQDASASSVERAHAAFQTKWMFGGAHLDRVQPTRFANAVGSYEHFGYMRWGFDVVAVWPRVEVLMTDQERQLDIDARTDVAFFINGSLGSLLVAMATTIDALRTSSHGLEFTVIAVVIAILVARFLYMGAVGAARRLSERRGASLDLHRGELLAGLGFREPAGYEDGIALGRALSRFLLFGEPPPDDLLATRGVASALSDELGTPPRHGDE